MILGKTAVELSLRANGLGELAGFNATGTFAVVTLLAPSYDGVGPQVLGRTETIKDEHGLNPDWIKSFVFDFSLGVQKYFIVTVYAEGESHDYKEIGHATFEIGHVLGAPGNVRGCKLNTVGSCYATVDKLAPGDKGSLSFKIRGIKLPNVERNIFSKSDPFFKVCRKEADGTWSNVFSSHFVKGDLSPVWKKARIGVGALCWGDLARPIKISIHDHSKSGNHIYMGSFETSVNGLLQAATKGEPYGLEKGKIEVTGAIVHGGPTGAAETIPDAPVEKPTFVDYLSSGLELNVSVAIDFTSYNGDPKLPTSLHRLGSESFNEYEKAITSVVSVLANYDSDQKFPVFGFGARYEGKLQHCFQCGLTPEVEGVGGVLDAYRSVFKQTVTMSNQTYFIDVIRMAAAKAAIAQKKAQLKRKTAYSILLILTCGRMSNTKATREAIAKISGEPLSIVIVGIGNADFASMQLLDDGIPGRDIVQFVEFAEHSTSEATLRAATLEEIPYQVEQYFETQCIQPGKKITVNENDIVVYKPAEIDLKHKIAKNGNIKVHSGGFYDTTHSGPTNYRYSALKFQMLY